MGKVIDAFLRKESCKNKGSLWTNGSKIFQSDTCIAQWEGHKVLVNASIYQIKELDEVITDLLKAVEHSWIPYDRCYKYVPPGSGDLTKFK